MDNMASKHHHQMAKHHARVGKTYDTSGLVTHGFEFEMERLEKHSPVEFAITKRYLQRYIQDGATVVDIGVGAGHYGEILARRGCTIHMVDVAQRLLEAAEARLLENGLAKQIASVSHASATHLSMLPDESCDIALLLGPLYHLSLPEERQQAVAEAKRVLRKDGLLFASGINRMTILHYMYCGETDQIGENKDFLDHFMQTGTFFPPEPDMPSTVYLTTLEVFRAEFAGFRELILAGVESFAQYDEQKFLKKTSENAEIWLDLIEQTGRTSEGLGMTGHFLYIGQK